MVVPLWMAAAGVALHCRFRCCRAISQPLMAPVEDSLPTKSPFLLGRSTMRRQWWSWGPRVWTWMKRSRAA